MAKRIISMSDWIKQLNSRWWDGYLLGFMTGVFVCFVVLWILAEVAGL